jgi:hypothetical protein
MVTGFELSETRAPKTRNACCVDSDGHAVDHIFNPHEMVAMREVLKTLNDCTAALNEEVATGIASVYITIDRHKYNELLKALTEAKRAVLRDRVL